MSPASQAPQVIRIWELQHRPEKPKPWVVRWTVDGRPHSRSFQTKAPAARYRSRLIAGYEAGERFDPGRLGEPLSWHPQGRQIPVYDWARSWLAEQWDELAPRTRDSYVDAMSRFVPVAVAETAPAPPQGIYVWLSDTLRPEASIDPHDDRERWLRRWGLTLGDLDRAVLADIDVRLGRGVRGQPLAAATANRRRKGAKACVRRAVELEKIPADPWPPSRRGRSRRKANRITREVDIRQLPNPDTMRTVLDAMATKWKPAAGRRWQMMSEVAYYAGLRPSEVLRLRSRAVKLPYLPAGGWGEIELTAADDGYDNDADPKTGRRVIPTPPPLTASLHAYLSECRLPPDGLLFRTSRGTKPTLSNWRRALRRACEKTSTTKLKPYDLRHACATTWLQAGVPLGEAARRLGHSVQTLVAHYIQALTGDEAVANQRIEDAIAPRSRARPANSAASDPTTPNKGTSPDGR